MKNKFVIINFALSIVVLFSILFQSVHSYEHLAKQISEKKCLHKHNSNTEITHQHDAFENCFVCGFTFSSFISQDIIAFKFKKTAVDLTIPFGISRAITPYFKGALFALRAPPIV